jgi:hypothetical protein
MDLRYDGSDHADGSDESDLVLVDDLLLLSTNGESNRDPAYFGVLSDVLRWHHQDPVDDLERLRHGVVAVAQGNRNPFVDHPEWWPASTRASATRPPPSSSPPAASRSPPPGTPPIRAPAPATRSP